MDTSEKITAVENTGTEEQVPAISTPFTAWEESLCSLPLRPCWQSLLSVSW